MSQRAQDRQSRGNTYTEHVQHQHACGTSLSYPPLVAYGWGSGEGYISYTVQGDHHSDEYTISQQSVVSLEMIYESMKQLRAMTTTFEINHE